MISICLYLVRSSLVTMVFNDPLNVALDSVKAADSAGAKQWTG